MSTLCRYPSCVVQNGDGPEPLLPACPGPSDVTWMSYEVVTARLCTALHGFAGLFDNQLLKCRSVAGPLVTQGARIGSHVSCIFANTTAATEQRGTCAGTEPQAQAARACRLLFQPVHRRP